MLNFYKLSAQPLADHRWNDRLILIFGSKENASLANKQVEKFQNVTEGLLDRDLLIYRINEEGVVGPKGKQDKSIANWFYEHYSVGKNAFQVLLIGKDGGEKLRENNLVTPEKIYALIDTMPMRRAEMRQKKKSAY